MKYIRKHINEDYITGYDDTAENDDSTINDILTEHHIKFALDELLSMIQNDYNTLKEICDHSDTYIFKVVKNSELYNQSLKNIDDYFATRPLESITLAVAFFIQDFYDRIKNLIEHSVAMLQHIKDGKNVVVCSFCFEENITSAIFDYKKGNDNLYNLHIYQDIGIDSKHHFLNSIDCENTTLQHIKTYIDKLNSIDKDYREIDSSFINSFKDSCNYLVDIICNYREPHKESFKIEMNINHNKILYLIDYICLQRYLTIILNYEALLKKYATTIYTKLTNNNIPIDLFCGAKSENDIRVILDNYVRTIINFDDFVKYYNYIHSQVKLIDSQS